MVAVLLFSPEYMAQIHPPNQSEKYHLQYYPPGLAEIPSPIGGSGSYITNEGLKPKTIGGQ